MRRLVVCCDGTWNSADQEKNGLPCPTNVVRLGYRIAKADGPIAQIIHYNQGVGTGNALDRLSGGAFGAGLEDNVHDAYRFLIANYELGDEIFLFGFSRGAFTARSIGGIVRKCGILRRASVAQYHRSLDLYRDQTHPDDEEPQHFRRQHSVASADDIPIQMIGVWDTVGALGIPLRGLRALTRRRHRFHDTELAKSVRFAAQALAIDEHREPFAPALWLDKPKDGQHVEQIWFCGAHSDVGGGYPEPGLSDIALEWMLAKAQSAGLRIDPIGNPALAPKPQPEALLHNSKIGLYLVTRGVDRVIGLEARDPNKSDSERPGLDHTQSLHPSVRSRWDSCPDYRPSNLRAYFKRTGDPRAAAR